MKEVLIDHGIVKKTENAMMWGGAVVSFIAGISLSSWGVFIGIVVTLLGFYMKWREHQMKEREHKLTVEKTNAEIFEIKTRTIFMERAGLNPVSYHTPPPALQALKDSVNE